MSARKKTSKGSAKKQEESASKSRTLSLLAVLKQKSSSYLGAPQGDNITAEILEALLQKQSSKLDNLLLIWSYDKEAVRHVAENLVESKIILFIQKITQLLEKDQQKLYLYPWLEEIYSARRNPVSQETNERLAKICNLKVGETEELIKLGGKLGLILQQ